jgi:hypothetical protein
LYCLHLQGRGYAKRTTGKRQAACEKKKRRRNELSRIKRQMGEKGNNEGNMREEKDKKKEQK